jgi:hypothetical protein
LATYQRGKLVILLMIAVAIAMSGYAWWHQFQSGRRSAEFWGSAEAVRVRYAPHVEFRVLRPAEESASQEKYLTILGVPYHVDEPVDVTQSRGLVHARHALVDDLSYDWNASIPTNTNWEFLLRFRDRDQLVTVAFDAEQGLICFVDQSRVNQFIPKIAAAFRQKRDEWKKL